MNLFTHRNLAAVGLLSVAAALPVVSAGPAAAAATNVSLQGEQMRVESGRAAVYHDASASGQRALLMATSGTAAATVTTGTARQIVLRLRGDQFRGAPTASVSVDGRRAATLAVGSSAWKSYAVNGSWAPGRHVVRVSFTNDYSVRRAGDRNLRVDSVQVTGAAASAKPAAMAAATSAASSSVAYRTRILQLVNAERARAGRRPLALSTCAGSYASQWSAHMAATGALVHRTNLGAVMTSCAARGAGENIGSGNVSADQMMAMWMHSPAHRANILDPSYTQIGIAASGTPSGRVWATQNFLVK